MTQITQGASIVQFGYDTSNRRTSLTLPNNIRVEYGYDAASRVTSITYKQNGTTVIGDLTYEYDKAGNRTKIGGSWARTGMPEPVTNTSYDAGNRQLAFADKSLTYDDNGNLQSITDSNGTTLYQWNARNQLVGISGPSVNASFVYDGMGRREAKTINGSLTEFLYDGVNPVQETAGTTVLANVLPGLGIDEFLTRTDVVAGVTSNFLTGALGSPVALTDNAGAVRTEYAYEAFGRTTATGTLNSTSYHFTGRENDGTELYYYRARYFHPALQRFISEDPIGFVGGDQNLFAYVKNSPVSKKDPLGLAPCENDEECRRQLAACMAHAMKNEIACLLLVSSGAAICYAGASLACAAAGPAYPICLAAAISQCATAVHAGLFVCKSILTAEMAECTINYLHCLQKK